MTDLASRLALWLDGRGPEGGGATLPVERLAAALGAPTLDDGPRAPWIALLGDGLTGGLLYRTHPTLVLDRLASALLVLPKDAHFTLLSALLELRPIRQEDLARFVALALGALGIEPTRARSIRDEWTPAQKLVVYRFSSCLMSLPALLTQEIATLLRERGIDGEGATPLEIFHDWLDLRAAFAITPRESPAARRELRAMERSDWLDLPFMLGTRKSSFTLDEIEEDSSPENMADGNRVVSLLLRQRAPTSDFYVSHYAWHPRQTMERIVAEAKERGIALIAPAPRDHHPERVDREKLSHAARVVQARAIRALSAMNASELPVDLALSFYEVEEGEVGALEVSIASSLKSDGKKHSVRLFLGDPEQVVSAIDAHRKLLTPASLPMLLAELYPLCPHIQVTSPSGPWIEVTADMVEAWTGTPAPARARFETTRALETPAEIAGGWHGHFTHDQYEDHQPVTLELSRDEDGLRGLLTLGHYGVIPTSGSVIDGRLALRQDDARQGLVFDGAWDREARTIVGRFAQYGMGGPIQLAQNESVEARAAEELVREIIAIGAGRTRFDVAALRFPGEEALLGRLFEDEHFRTAYLEQAKDRATGADAMRLDALLGRGSSELTRAMLPGAFEALDIATEALGFTDTVRLFVHNDSSLNAFVTTVEGAIAVHFSSGVLETLVLPELAAVIGHELGHVLLGSHELALRTQRTAMSGETRERYFALCRLEELSADRLSLLACGDLAAVVTAQTMLRTGVRRRELFGTVDALVESAQKEIDVLRSRGRNEHRALETHPYLSARTVALELFSRSELFARLRPEAPRREPRLDDASFARALDELGALLAPPRPAEEAARADLSVERFLALAALQLVEADRVVTAKEVAALRRLDDAVTRELDVVLGFGRERRDTAILEVARHVVRTLSVPEREEKLLGLLDVVRADNVLQGDETNLIGELGRLLELDTHTFRKTMDELYRGTRY